MFGGTFIPAEGRTSVVANSVTATAAIEVPYGADAVALSNTSTTATTFVRITYYLAVSEIGAGDPPTVTTDFPVLPATQIVRAVQNGKHSVIRTIASAADGNIIITPGHIV